MDRRVIVGGFSEAQARQMLLATVTRELQNRAGYVADTEQFDTVVIHGQALAMYRTKPKFSMSYGWYDNAYEWLYEYLDARDYPHTLWVFKRSAIIREITKYLRDYVKTLDRRYKTGELE